MADYWRNDYSIVVSSGHSSSSWLAGVPVIVASIITIDKLLLMILLMIYCVFCTVLLFRIKLLWLMWYSISLKPIMMMCV